MTVGWAEAEKKRIPSNKGTRCGEGDRWKKKKKKNNNTKRAMKVMAPCRSS